MRGDYLPGDLGIVLPLDVHQLLRHLLVDVEEHREVLEYKE